VIEDPEGRSPAHKSLTAKRFLPVRSKLKKNSSNLKGEAYASVFFDTSPALANL
jgi:hypothetical protein